ncbi:MAG: SDR family NAD(P)-dependent oxidoreductase [Sediminibacterium sp.]|nr:SDR family NAD(P)-dependent oxidoreductase [Sediminibacterium sp.]
MIVVITGASKGIGKAIAEQFAGQGHQLLLCSRGEKSLYDTVADLQNRFPECTVNGRVCDMSNKTEVQDFAFWCLQQGTPDILVNNAGQFVPGSIHNEADGILEQMIKVNLYSAYYLTRALLPAMIQAQSGHIFNICSIASLNAYANGGSYSISKFALLGFSKNLREELKPKGIKVTAVCPGATLSSSWEGFEIDPKRIMETADVAKMILAAASLSPMAVVEDIILRPQLGDL